jgi:hypothetical protein
MLRRFKAPELDREFLTSARHGRFPRVALRKRSNEHPMAMFAMLVTTAFVSMALMTPGTAIFAARAHAAAKPVGQVQESGKSYRLPPVNAGRACHGQAWGAETEQCVLAIIRDSGKNETYRIRMIASAEPVHTTPNIF